MTTPAPVPAVVTPRQEVARLLAEYRPVLENLLPAGISVDRFKATVANALRKNPDLVKCDPTTILAGALRAAQLGLEPNDERNLCYLIPRGGSATFQLGYGGVMELARRAVRGLRFDGRAVYPNDDFDLDYGRTPQVIHRPNLGARGGEAVAWYVQAFFPDGTTQTIALGREGVEYHRNFSKMKDSGMWKDSYDAGALKSCVHELKRWLPSSPELATALAADEAVVTLAEMRDEADDESDVIEITAGD